MELHHQKLNNVHRSTVVELIQVNVHDLIPVFFLGEDEPFKVTVNNTNSARMSKRSKYV